MKSGDLLTSAPRSRCGWREPRRTGWLLRHGAFAPYEKDRRGCDRNAAQRDKEQGENPLGNWRARRRPDEGSHLSYSKSEAVK